MCADTRTHTKFVKKNRTNSTGMKARITNISLAKNKKKNYKIMGIMNEQLTL